MKISESVQMWYESAKVNALRTKKKASGNKSAVVEHPPLPHTANAYKGGVDKFLIMLEREFGVSLDGDVRQLSMRHFIRFPKWIKEYSYQKGPAPAEGEEKPEQVYLSLASCKLFTSGVISYLNWLQDRELVEPVGNDEHHLERARKEAAREHHEEKPRSSEPGSIEAILKVSQESPAESPIKERNIAIVHLLAYSGLRASEVGRLKMQHLNLENHKGVTIGKGSKEAVFHFFPVVVPFLQAYWEARGWEYNPDDPVFAAHDFSVGGKKKKEKHRHLTRTAIYQIVDGLAKEASVKAWPHAFRHFFITYAYGKTQDIVLVKNWARHTDVKMTDRYIHIEEVEAEKKFNELIKKMGDNPEEGK